MEYRIIKCEYDYKDIEDTKKTSEAKNEQHRKSMD